MWWQIIVLVCGALAWFSADVLGCLLNGGRIVAKTSGGKTLRLRHFTRKHTLLNFVRAIGIGIVVGLAHCLPKSTESPIWGCVFFIAMMVLLVLCTVWFLLHAKRWSELLWYIVLMVAVIWAAEAAVNIMALWWDSRALTWVFNVVPWMVFAILIGFAAFVLAIRFFRHTSKVLWKVVAIILAIATVASVATIAVNGSTIAGLPAVKGAEAQQIAGEEPDAGVDYWCVFYNDECQKNDTVDDDLNFGLNPYKKGMSATELKNIHKKVTLTDAANGTVAMCWVDQHIGTRYMGDKFYSEYKGKDDAAINEAIGVYVDNEKLYKDTMTVFWTCMDRATVEIRDVGKGSLHDQMYMNPGNQSLRGIPDVAVYFPRGDESGHYLVYTFTIKGATVEVPFRVECLFQPTNVTEYLDVEVQEKPSNPDNPDSPVNPTEPAKPNPTEPANPYNKDKSLSDNSGTNDNPNEGKDTNNGEDAKGSSEDVNGGNGTPRNAAEEEQRHENDNQGQKTGQDGSTPSTNGGGTVDNNGDDANRPVERPKETAIAEDPEFQQWDGPDI